jgi:hypothetical protein
MDYLADAKYMIDSDRPGICYGFGYRAISTTSYDVHLFFSDNGVQGARASIPSTLKAAFDPFISAQESSNKALYTASGFSFLQNWFANRVLQIAVSDQKASVVIGVFPMTNPAFVADDFAQIIA